MYQNFVVPLPKIFETMTKIKQDRRNYRVHNDENKRVIRKSLEELGAGRSIVIDNEGEIIAGNGVYEQAQKLGIKTKIVETDGSELVVVKRTDLATGDDKRKKLALADNAASDTSEWADELLREDWTPEVLADWGVELPEIEEAPTEEAQEDDFDEEKDPIEKRAALGDLWLLGEHRIVCGDMTDKANIELLLKGDKASMIFTDPPYGMGLNTDYSSLTFNGRKGIKWEQGAVDDFDPAMLQVIFDLDVKETFLWGADYYIEHIPNRKDGSWLVWDKTLESNGDAGSNSEFELCWSKQKHKRKVIHFNWFRFFGLSKQDAKKRLHPTQKPLQVISPFLEKYSKASDIVLDLFGGSGSTLIACEQLGRKCYMMELDQHYCDVIIARWEKLTGQKAIKL